MHLGIKATLIVFNSLIIILCIILCIGLFTPVLGNTVYEVLNIVPETKYNEVVENKVSLNTQIGNLNNEIISLGNQITELGENNSVKSDTILDLENQLNALNLEKENLMNQINNLDITNANQASLLTEYESQISSLYIQIETLSQRINELNEFINNSNIIPFDTYASLTYGLYDENDNFLYYSGLTENSDYTHYFTGNDLIAYLNTNFMTFKQTVEKSASFDSSNTTLILYETYDVFINGYSQRVTINPNKVFTLVNNCTVEMTIHYLDVPYTIEEFINIINTSSGYHVDIYFDYAYGGLNDISYLSCKLIVGNA